MSAPTSRQFTMTRTLGRGGFGEVYQAEMRSPSGLVATVAVKVLHTGLDPRSQAVKRLEDEGRILSMLRHPGIVGVHDLAVLDGRVALVTEYIEGADLIDCLDGEGAIPHGALCEAFAIVAGALQAAHEAKGADGERLELLHRDVKPGNIRMGRHGEVKLLDFGIATAGGGIERQAATQTNALIGSFPYMAPERFRRKPVGPPSDFYSLGCTLYEVFATARLYPFEDMAHIVAHKSSAENAAEIVDPALEALDVPADLKSLISDMLSFEAGDRPSGPEIIARLEDLAADLGGTRLSRWARGYPWPVEASNAPGPLSGRILLDGEQSPPEATVFVDSDLVVLPPPRRWGPILGLLVPVLTLLLAAGAAVFLGVVIAMVVLPSDGADDTLVVEQVDPPDVQPVVQPVADPDPLDSDDSDAIDPKDPEPTAPDSHSPGPAPTPNPQDGVADATGTPPPDCGDADQLEAAAKGGILSTGNRACLASLMKRKKLRLVERRRHGRILLVDAKNRCEASQGCADYEKHQQYYFSELDRSDPEMMFTWAQHLYAKGRKAEVHDWVESALERKSVWKGSTFVKRVDALYGLDARAAYELWQATPRDERLRIEARDASARWASYRGQLGRDTTAAMDMCTSAAGSAAPCEARVHDSAARVEVVFASVPGGAEVLVDGASIGNTPSKTELTVGRHSVQIRGDGISGAREIEVGTGKPTRWTWTASGDDWSSAL